MLELLLKLSSKIVLAMDGTDFWSVYIALSNFWEPWMLQYALYKSMFRATSDFSYIYITWKNYLGFLNSTSDNI